MSQPLTTLEAKTDAVLRFLQTDDADVLYITGGGMTGKTSAVKAAIQRLPAEYPHPILVSDNSEPFRLHFLPKSNEIITKTIIINLIDHYTDLRDALEMDVEHLEFARE
jgi:hypothetical protein